MEKKDKIVEIIDYSTEKTLYFFKKIGKLISNRKSHDTVEIFTKIVVTLLLIAVLRIPFLGIEKLGELCVYSIGNTFRYIFSISWIIMVRISYTLISFIIMLNIVRKINEDKELNIIEDDRKKDTKIKNKLFLPIIKLINIGIMFINCILSIIEILITIVIVELIIKVINGYGLIGLLLITFGLFIMILSSIITICQVVKLKEIKKGFVLLFSGLIIFFVGIIAINYELKSYKFVDYLPDDITLNTETYYINIEDNENYKIDKTKYNGIEINQIIDNSLENAIKIEVVHTKSSKNVMLISNKNNDNEIYLTNSSKLSNIKIKEISNLIDRCMKEKTIYNYKQLKYSTINIYGSKEILEKIEIDKDE